MKIRALLFFLIIFSVKAEQLTFDNASPIRQGVHVEWYRTVVPSLDGSAIFVWSDTRFGMRNVFAHKIDKNGNILWGETGTVVTNLPGRQEDPVAIEDGDGGAFIAWVDYRFDDAGDVFIQHVNNDGSILMDPNGVALAQFQGQQISINMCTDSLGGVFVTWQDKRGGVDDDIYGTHVDANHNIVEPGIGIPIVVQGGTQSAKSIEYAGNNEAFICWSDSRQGENIDIYGQRLDVAMSPTFTENGIPIASTAGLETRPRTTFVNNTTSIVTWKFGDENARILFQFVDQNGLVFSSAKPVSEYDAIQTGPRLKRNSQGDVFLSWKDLRFDPVDGDIFMQKINATGALEWNDGVQVDLTEGVNFSGRFSANSVGGFDIFWEKGIFPNVDILFQSFDLNGQPQSDAPIIVAGDEGYQFAPNIITGSNDSVFVVYADQGSGSVDLKINYYKGITSLFETGGLLAVKGLDGDIKYNVGFPIDDEKIVLVWEDNRASKKIYANVISSGELSHLNGNQISFSDNSSTEIDLSSPFMINASNSIYTTTFDATATPKKIRINKLNAELENIWDQNGISLNPENDQRNAHLVDLGDQGVGCFWSESRSFLSGFDIYFQSLNNNGESQLVSGGIVVAESNGDDYIQSILPTPDGGFLIFWVEEVWPASRLKYNKVDASGSTAIGWPPNGYSLSNQSIGATNLNVKAISEANGVLAVWNQEGNFSDIYAQKINWDGQIEWNASGEPISIEDNDQSAISFDIDESGITAFIAWEDYRNGTDYNIVGKEINLISGSITEVDVYFTSDTTSQQKPLVKSVADGEYIIVWEDGRGYYNNDPLLINGVDLYGSAYIVGFGRTTGPDGIPMSVEYHDQKKPAITKYSGNDYLLHWIDLRSSGKEDLANYYAKLIRRSDILSNGKGMNTSSLPENFNIESVYPNPFNGKVKFDFTIGTPQLVAFNVYDITGKMIVDELIMGGAKGYHQISWDGKNRYGDLVSSGVYYYTFTLQEKIVKGKLTYLK
jgi:hypothetical protein|tara:strand:- start:5039 stop:8056 length:3018 start_codon:yes stop_codon:yes gene_type:complete